MLISRYRKQPREVRRTIVDYSVWLDEGEHLSALETEVREIVEGGGQGSPVTVSSAVIDPGGYNRAIIYVAAGRDGDLSKITILATTNDGQVREDEVEVMVQEL